MDDLFLLAVATVVIVLVFDYTNGFHDAANIVATVIASRAMTPAQAVIIVGVFEFLGPLLGGTAVANTIGKFVALDGVAPMLSLSILLCGLIGAIVWNLGTWYFGIPSSSSHALVGGLIGAVVVSVGADHVVWGFAELADGHLTGIVKVLAALVLSPLIGFWVGFLVHRLLTALLIARQPGRQCPAARRPVRHRRRPGLLARRQRRPEEHGHPDPGAAARRLHPDFEVPFWVMLACASAITLGILSGGWRIVRTLGFAIYRVRPIHALGSQLTSAGVILAASVAAPRSRPPTSSPPRSWASAPRAPARRALGQGQGHRVTWVITIPGAALVAIQAYALVNLFLGGKP
jgi:PiT family inorganic phosphate transporter